MKLEEYYMVENKRANHTMVMCTERPFILGSVYMIDIDDADRVEAMLKSIADGDRLAVKVRGHSIFICFANVLDKITVGSEEIRSCLREMADFYLIERIGAAAGAYTRYREGHELVRRKDTPEYIMRLLINNIR